MVQNCLGDMSCAGGVPTANVVHMCHSGTASSQLQNVTYFHMFEGAASHVTDAMSLSNSMLANPATEPSRAVAKLPPSTTAAMQRAVCSSSSFETVSVNTINTVVARQISSQTSKATRQQPSRESTRQFRRRSQVHRQRRRQQPCATGCM